MVPGRGPRLPPANDLLWLLGACGCQALGVRQSRLSSPPFHCCPATASVCLQQEPLPQTRQQPLRWETIKAAAAGPGAGTSDCRSRQPPRRRPR